MTLNDLPPELLLEVLSNLTSSFFRQDLRRLTVSRKWYEFALQVIAHDIELEANSLLRLTENGAALEKSRLHVASIKLTLIKTESFAPLAIAKDPTRGQSMRQMNENNEGLIAMAADIGRALGILTATLQHAPKLRHLDFCARACFFQSNLRPAHACFSMEPLTQLGDLQHLTSLKIDFAYLRLYTAYDSFQYHLCDIVNSLIPTLKRLHCRLQTVCEYLLEPPLGRGKMQLEELILNMSLSQLSPEETGTRLPQSCEASRWHDALRLRQRVETQAVDLASRLEKPHLVRVIYHEMPSLKVLAFDALEKRRMELKDNLHWDAIGEVIPPPAGSGTDLFDSSSSSDLNEFLVDIT